MYGRAVDDTARSAWHGSRQAGSHGNCRCECAAPGGPGQPAIQGAATESALGVGLFITDSVLDALEQALYARQPGDKGALIHYSDRSQYVSIRYSERLAEAGIEPSVGSWGDSYDNALAETINGLYKTELIHRRAPWKMRESVELATLEWMAWYNHHRLMKPLGYIPPAEAETNYYGQFRNVTGVPALT